MFAKDGLFWFCALAGSGMFLIQFLLFFLGADAEDDASSQNFKWLSKQAVTGFLMMFGWVGLASKVELGFTTLTATFIAILAGSVAMIITASIFNLARKLRSTGSVFRLQDAIGKEASVYQRIPKGGSGKISLSLHDMTHEIDAISLNGEEVNSFTQVQIIKKADERTVVVIPIK
jgi:membrane protein implicated in regulation of membrane protease activity